MNDAQKQALFGNTARQINGAEVFIQQRHIRNCYKADPAYGAGVAEALGLDLEEALSAHDPVLSAQSVEK